MARQISMTYQFPPVLLLAPAADAGGRTSTVYPSLRNALKVFVVVHINQGNAATVLLSLLQATSSGGAGSKAISNNAKIYANTNTGSSDALVAQADGTTFTTDAGTHDKYIVFEFVPEAVLDMANGFNHIGISTGASNAANITEATVFILEGQQGASAPTTVA